jgi:hypothetical protein
MAKTRSYYRRALPRFMVDALSFSAAFLCSLLGMAYLALSMPQHFPQAVPERKYSGVVAWRLRASGVVLISSSLVACSLADHMSMVPLVWVMMLTTSAIAVAVVLAYRPRVFWPFGALFASRAKK